MFGIPQYGEKRIPMLNYRTYPAEYVGGSGLRGNISGHHACIDLTLTYDLHSALF